MSWILLITYLGTFVFAVTGALKARTHQMDLLGAAILAFVTAYGGGTVRDILIGIKPVNWMNDYLALGLVVSAVLIVWLFPDNVIRFRRTIFLTDALGLGFFTVLGIYKSLALGINSGFAILMGVVTATFGGLLADILSNTVPDLLKKGELYATACLIGGLLQVILAKAEVNENLNLGICVVVVVSIRILSKLKRIYLPEI
jgi:uncharacterized membrane protein YeiH